ncbi:CD83 antigen [Paralichthys olivaceus]|uniref:CD83 antigen n=1 Tax=Paralichthys olivaceus TaxID=8255 RepID=UPI0037537F59
MSQTVFLIQLLLVHFTTTQSIKTIQSDCGENVSLRCPYDDMDSIDFISVAWYKFKNQRREGIARRKRKENGTVPYSLDSSAKIGDTYSLLLHNVTPEDSGTYDCALNANIGGQNLNSMVNLTVSECETPKTSVPPINKQAEDLSVLWSILGYVTVALVKILLSLITALVIRVMDSRKPKDKWRS